MLPKTNYNSYKKMYQMYFKLNFMKIYIISPRKKKENKNLSSINFFFLFFFCSNGSLFYGIAHMQDVLRVVAE